MSRERITTPGMSSSGPLPFAAPLPPNQPAAREVCEHYWAWVSPAGASKSARLCMLCHTPSADWLNHVVEVDRGHDGCAHCEFADPTTEVTP